MPKEIWKTLSVYLIFSRIWLPPSKNFSPSGNFFLCLFLFQRLFKAGSTMLSSIIRKEQACLHLLLFCKYCHLLSCTVSRPCTARLEECFGLSRSKFPWYLHLHLDSRSALPWLEASLSQMLSKSVMRDLLDSCYITDQREINYSCFCFCKKSMHWLSVLSCPVTIFGPCFIELILSKKIIISIFESIRISFSWLGDVTKVIHSLFSFLSSFVSHSLSLSLSFSYSPTFSPFPHQKTKHDCGHHTHPTGEPSVF